MARRLKNGNGTPNPFYEAIKRYMINNFDNVDLLKFDNGGYALKIVLYHDIAPKLKENPIFLKSISGYVFTIFYDSSKGRDTIVKLNVHEVFFTQNGWVDGDFKNEEKIMDDASVDFFKNLLDEVLKRIEIAKQDKLEKVKELMIGGKLSNKDPLQSIMEFKMEQQQKGKKDDEDGDDLPEFRTF